ncbi:MAG: hypothetical protein IIY06_12585 [Proteobacteria bacterium]|nr:hypothetical protein [Pseudomonadota bacterium]
MNKKQLRFGFCLAAAMLTFYACEDSTITTPEDKIACSTTQPCADNNQKCVEGYCVDKNSGDGQGGQGQGGDGQSGQGQGGDGQGGQGQGGDGQGGDGQGGQGQGGDGQGGQGQGGDGQGGDGQGGQGQGGDGQGGDGQGGQGQGGHSGSKYDMTDTDGDTIPDTYDRCDEDTDEDSTPNCQDPDSDGDTIPDSLEAGELEEDGEPIDSDMDGIYDFMDTDSDDNSIPDNLECIWGQNTLDATEPITACDDTDDDGIPDYLDQDNDGDSLYDRAEIFGIVGKLPLACNNPAGCASADCNDDGQPDPLGSPDAPFVCRGTLPAFMNPDSDGDGIGDSYELTTDSNADGYLDIYSLDSDGDGIPDADERCGQVADCDPSAPPVKTNGLTYDFKNADIDADGLRDGDEIECDNGRHSRYFADVDDDHYGDAAEFAVAQYAIKNHVSVNKTPITQVSQLLCDPDINVKNVFEFYFELPYQGPEDDDTLYFTPAVSKLDLVFNVDTTGSMGGTITSVKTNIKTIIKTVKDMVTDSGFALVNFDDYPDVQSHDGSSSWSTAGSSSSSDMPFRLLGAVSTDNDTVEAYTNNSLFRTRSGSDGAESGTVSLYRIATNEVIQWRQYDKTNQQLEPRENAAGTWGGVGFRQNTLPVVVHVSDIYSHEAETSTYLDRKNLTDYYKNRASLFYYKECANADDIRCAISPRYTDDLIPKLQSTGVRVISLNVGSGDTYNQMTTWSRESNAIVPACAFKTAENTWKCGTNTQANMCCLGSAKPAQTVNGKENQCILVYSGSQSAVADYISKGVDALVKYGTYEVSTQIIGEAIPGKSYGTECFIKKVEALSYIPPAQEPEKSCNPVAEPYVVDSTKGYIDGFRNFATGTSTAGKAGAQLTFKVVAENDTCVEPTSETQVFEATIRVINPTTGLKFADQKVSILVPAVESTIIY